MVAKFIHYGGQIIYAIYIYIYIYYKIVIKAVEPANIIYIEYIYI